MIDNYYVDLARHVMAEAEGKLVAAQKYLRDAGLDDEIKVTQRTINSIRKQNDYLALLPPNKAIQAELLSPDKSGGVLPPRKPNVDTSAGKPQSA